MIKYNKKFFTQKEDNDCEKSKSLPCFYIQNLKNKNYDTNKLYMYCILSIDLSK